MLCEVRVRERARPTSFRLLVSQGRKPCQFPVTEPPGKRPGALAQGFSRCPAPREAREGLTKALARRLDEWTRPCFICPRRAGCQKVENVRRRCLWRNRLGEGPDQNSKAEKTGDSSEDMSRWIPASGSGGPRLTYVGTRSR